MNNFDAFYFFSLVLSILITVSPIWFYRNKKKLKLKRTLQVIIWNVLLCCSFLSATYLIGESYYRFFVDTTDSFALNKVSQRWMKKHYNENNHFGYRDNIEYHREIAQGKRRMSIIGDSFTAGHGIKNVDHRFGNILRNSKDGLETHILAVNGANSLTHLTMLHELKQSSYEFDFIILAYCLNDIDHLIPEASQIYNQIHAFNINLSYLARKSYFINTLAFRLFAYQNPQVQNYSDFVLDAYSGKTWEQQQASLMAIRNLVLQLKKPLLVVTFPFLQNKKEDYKFIAVHQKLNDFWKEQKTMHLDLLNSYSPYLGSELTVNDFDAHPNEFAHQLAADAIDNFLSGNRK